MKVSDILRVKGNPNTLYTVTPDEPLSRAIGIMADKDIGSLVVLDRDKLVGMLTFREVILCVDRHGGTASASPVSTAMDDHPPTCTPDTELDEVRRIMLESHARYLPVIERGGLTGVISFYDVAKAIVESEHFENSMLKAYISDTHGPEASTAPRL
jgi:CBS domain-containing protein